jgi:hypothetical protein
MHVYLNLLWEEIIGRGKIIVCGEFVKKRENIINVKKRGHSLKKFCS